MVERGIRIVGMMDYIDANSNIFFEYSLRAQGIFEEVVPAHRNEKGPCHRQIAHINNILEKAPVDGVFIAVSPTTSTQT